MTLNSFLTSNRNHKWRLNRVRQSKIRRTLTLKNLKKISILKVLKWTLSFRIPTITILLKRKSLWAFSTKITIKNSSKKSSYYRTLSKKANKSRWLKSTRT